MVQQYLGKPIGEIPKKRLKKLGFYSERTNEDICVQKNKENEKLLYIKDSPTEDFKLSAHLRKIKVNFDNHVTLISCINSKIEKLKKHYDIRKQNYLAIIAPEQTLSFKVSKESIRNFFIETFKNEFRKHFCDTTPMFDIIYIIFWDTLLILNTVNMEMSCMDITEERLIELGYALSDKERERIETLVKSKKNSIFRR